MVDFKDKKIEVLRKKHPRFIYDSFQAKQQKDKLHIRFHFLLEPNVNFTPEIVVPVNSSLDQKELENFAFHLGLIEMISYWKAACPPELKVEAGWLSDEQITWWHDLFIHGMGEFFYHNQIDFTRPDFLQIVSSSRQKFFAPTLKSNNNSGDLILVGGGKDSSVTMELLKKMPGRKGCLILNPIKAALKTFKAAGYPGPLVVERTIDPGLLQLNAEGYLNGHTPFSAYLAFLGVFMATLHGYKNVIVSNDHSADQGNVAFHGLEINHQYSKSFRFEKLFREYAKSYLAPAVNYFSFLRPLYEIQITQLFAAYPQYHSVFRSCNVGQKENRWCGRCAKCAFAYLSLSPFLSFEEMRGIFGEDYYLKPEMRPLMRALTGLEKNKPFECVGTREESILVVALAIRKYRKEGNKVPPLLFSLEKELGLVDAKTVRLLEDKFRKEWNIKHFLPEEYVKLLKGALTKP